MTPVSLPSAYENVLIEQFIGMYDPTATVWTDLVLKDPTSLQFISFMYLYKQMLSTSRSLDMGRRRRRFVDPTEEYNYLCN